MWISPKLFLDQIGFPRGRQTFIQRCQEIMVSRVELRFIDQSDFVNKGNGFILKDCPDWELDSTISLELTALLDDISVFFRRNWSPRTAILIMKFQFRYWNLGRKKKTAAKDKRRNGNNRHTKQSKRPNVNSSEATFTRNSNENAKMQANHSRNQNKKAAEVLTKKGLESKLRPMCQTSSSNKPWKIWKPIESEWLIEEILELYLELVSSVAKDANKTRQVDLTFDGCCGPRVSKHCRNLSHSPTKENRF